MNFDYYVFGCFAVLLVGVQLFGVSVVDSRVAAISGDVAVVQSDLGVVKLLLDRSDVLVSRVNSTNAGAYSSRGKLLWVSINQSSKGVMDSVLHEYGHFVYYQVLDSSDVLDWNNLSNSTNEYVSDYARTSVSEDFAETFEDGISCSWVGNSSSVKSEWIREKAVPLLKKRGALS